MASNSTADSSPSRPSSEASSSERRSSSSVSESSEVELQEGPPTASPPFWLTFGVEFECLLLYKPKWYDQNLATLEQDGLPTRPHKFSIDQVKPRTTQEWQLEDYYAAVAEHHLRQTLRDMSVPVADGYEAKDGENVWVVERDETLTPDESGETQRVEQWRWLNLELKTRILHYCPEHLAEVSAVLKKLTATFNDGVNFKLYSNFSCGMHVHVGTQKLGRNKSVVNGGHSWTALRNLYTLGTLFEKQINTVFPADRVSGASGGHARPPSHTFRLFGDVHGALAVIEARSSWNDLERKADIPRKVAYNPNAQYKTIEFRQHHGSVDPDAATSWVRFVCGLIHVAYKAGDAGYPASFLERSKEEGFDFLALLTALNMDSLTEYYGKPGVLTEHPRLLPWMTAPGVFNTEFERKLPPRESYSVESPEGSDEEASSISNENSATRSDENSEEGNDQATSSKRKRASHGSNSSSSDKSAKPDKKKQELAKDASI